MLKIDIIIFIDIKHNPNIDLIIHHYIYKDAHVGLTSIGLTALAAQLMVFNVELPCKNGAPAKKREDNRAALESQLTTGPSPPRATPASGTPAGRIVHGVPLVGLNVVRQETRVPTLAMETDAGMLAMLDTATLCQETVSTLTNATARLNVCSMSSLGLTENTTHVNAMTDGLAMVSNVHKGEG